MSLKHRWGLVALLLCSLSSAPALAQDTSTLSTYSLYVYGGLKLLSSSAGGVCAAVVLSQKGGSGKIRNALMSSSQFTGAVICLAITSPEMGLIALSIDADSGTEGVRSPKDPMMLKIVRAQLLRDRRELTAEIAMGSGKNLTDLARVIEYAGRWRVSTIRFSRCLRARRDRILPGLSITDDQDPAVDESARVTLACAHESRTDKAR